MCDKRQGKIYQLGRRGEEAPATTATESDLNKDLGSSWSLSYLFGVCSFFLLLLPLCLETLIFETLPFLTEQPTIFPPENEIHEFFVCRETGTNSVPTPKQNKSTTGHNKRLFDFQQMPRYRPNLIVKTISAFSPWNIFFWKRAGAAWMPQVPPGGLQMCAFFSDLINEKRLSVLPNCPMEPSGICPNGRQRPRRASIDKMNLKLFNSRNQLNGSGRLLFFWRRHSPETGNATDFIPLD